MADLNPFLLAAVTPDPDPRLLPLLRANPETASKQDSHGYSLLHAAASYDHIELLRSLVIEFNVDVNLKDEDGETCLFVAETVDVAKCLVEELHIDVDVKNDDGMTAVEKFESEQEFPDIALYLQLRSGLSGSSTNGVGGHPPPLPPNMRIDVNTSTAEAAADGQEPDPEFRRRIEELASKEDFQSEERQQELRDLITDAIRGVGDERDVRRRVT